MADSEMDHESNNYLLGEILTNISSPKRPSSTIVLSEAILLEREPANLRDRWAIHVKNSQGTALGYLSRLVTKWLGPLLDSEKIRIEGYIPARSCNLRNSKRFSLPIVLSVSIAEEDRLLQKKNLRTREDVVHHIVFQSYQQAQRFTEPRLIEHLAEGLKLLARQKLHPETHLLIALLPGIANEHRVAQKFKPKAMAYFPDFSKQSWKIKLLYNNLSS